MDVSREQSQVFDERNLHLRHRAEAAQAQLSALQRAIEDRAQRFYDNHGEVDTEYVAAELRALITVPPSSQEPT